MLGRRLQDSRGAVAVEFAFVLPLLLLLVFGIVDFSRAYNAKVSLSGAAREGVRSLALGDDTGTVVARTKAAAPTLDPDDMLVDHTPATCAGQPGAEGRVVVEYTFRYVTPVPAFIGIGDSATLTGIGVMRCGG